MTAGTDDVLAADRLTALAQRTGRPGYEAWDLPHPPGSDLDGVRRVRDDIDRRVRAPLTETTTPDRQERS